MILECGDVSNIGKIGHPILSGKRLCQATRISEEYGRSLLCKLTEIIDQVRLVIISTFKRDARPLSNILVNGAEHLLKTQQTTQEFWTHTDFRQKSPAQLPGADTCFRGQRVHRQSSG